MSCYFENCVRDEKCAIVTPIKAPRTKRQNGQIFLDVFSKNKKSVRYSTKLILEYSLAGYNVFDTEPPSTLDGCKNRKAVAFAQDGYVKLLYNKQD